MIELEHVVLPSADQMKFVIEGMRNPLNSWDKSDSAYCGEADCTICNYSINKDQLAPYETATICQNTSLRDVLVIGDNDLALMNKLSEAGTDHRKFMRMMPVYVRITAPLYWWKEFDTYKIATVANSCSTMHKIHSKPFSIDDFSCDHMTDSTKKFMETIVAELETIRLRFKETKSKEDWYDMIQLLPSSYNQTRNVMLNYEVLANIYKSRRDHKLDEWKNFCSWIETLPHSDLAVGKLRKQENH